MKSPHSIRLEPRRSVMHASAVLVLTIILVALCVDTLPSNGLFAVKNGLWMAAVSAVVAWAAFQAWQLPPGHLDFAQGQWTWQRGKQELAGTLHLHLDLQSYMLVRFQPAGLNRSLFGRFFSTTAPWFHLEARHVSASALNAWPDVRRAVYFPSAVSTEPLSLKDHFNEKPAR